MKFQILSNILDYLPLQQVLKCRSVCREWNLGVIRHLEMKNLVKIQFNYLAESQFSSSASSSSISNRSLEQFTALMESSIEIPFTSYILKKTLPPDYNYEGHRILKFLRVCGPKIKALQISLPNTLDSGTFVQILKEIGQRLPNIQTLHLVNVFSSTRPESYQNSFRDSDDFGGFIFEQLQEIIYTQEDEAVDPELAAWTALFQASPNLSRLEMKFNMIEFKTTSGGDEIEAFLVAGRTNNLKQLR